MHFQLTKSYFEKLTVISIWKDPHEYEGKYEGNSTNSLHLFAFVLLQLSLELFFLKTDTEPDPVHVSWEVRPPEFNRAFTSQ